MSGTNFALLKRGNACRREKYLSNGSDEMTIGCKEDRPLRRETTALVVPGRHEVEFLLYLVRNGLAPEDRYKSL